MLSRVLKVYINPSQGTHVENEFAKEIGQLYHTFSADVELIDFVDEIIISSEPMPADGRMMTVWTPAHETNDLFINGHKGKKRLVLPNQLRG